MSVDAEIDEIRLTIAEIHRALYKIDAHLNGASEAVDQELGYFDQQMHIIRDQSKQMRNQVIETVSNFPNQKIYLIIAMILDLLIWLVVGLLLYKAVIAWKHRHQVTEKFMRKASGHPKKQITVNPQNDSKSYVVWKQPQPYNVPNYEVFPADGLLPVYSKVNTHGVYETTYGIDR